MEDNNLTPSMDPESRMTGRRHAVRALGAMGMALLGSLGLQNPSGAKNKKKKKLKRGPSGHAGSIGPQGPAGATGATGPDYVAVLKSGQPSSPLAVTKGAAVQSTVSCGKGKVLSCNYNVAATAEQLANVIVKSVGCDQGLETCGAGIVRTTDVGSVAGATVIAYAICKP